MEGATTIELEPRTFVEVGSPPKPKRERRLDPVKEAKAARALKGSLASLSAEEDQQLLLDTMEGETELFETLDALLARMAETRGLIAGLEIVVADLEARKKRLEDRLETDRAMIEQAMCIAEIDTLERPTATLSLSRRQPKLIVDTEADVPAEFWRPSDPKLDRKALADALKAGRSVPGAVLSNAAPSLTVRTR